MCEHCEELTKKAESHLQLIEHLREIDKATQDTIHQYRRDNAKLMEENSYLRKKLDMARSWGFIG